MNDDQRRKKFYSLYGKEAVRRAEQNDYLSVTVTDPLAEFKHQEKLELAEQKLLENKIQNKEKKIQENEEKNQKKKKAILDDYTEIYRILLKNKQDRMKENENSMKNTEEQNQQIKYFIEGAANRQKNDLNMLGKRQPMMMDRKDSTMMTLNNKHVAFFLENHPRYRKSKLLLKSLLKK